MLEASSSWFLAVVLKSTFRMEIAQALYVYHGNIIVVASKSSWKNFYFLGSGHIVGQPKETNWERLYALHDKFLERPRTDGHAWKKKHAIRVLILLSPCFTFCPFFSPTISLDEILICSVPFFRFDFEIRLGISSWEEEKNLSLCRAPS